MSKVAHTGIVQLIKSSCNDYQKSDKRLFSQISQRTCNYNNYRFVNVKKLCVFLISFFKFTRYKNGPKKINRTTEHRSRYGKGNVVEFVFLRRA